MMCKAEAITNYDFKPSDEFLVDTNIWLFVYGPQKPANTRVAVYSHALSMIFAAKSRIYIDVLIVSEFINTYARLKWKLLSPSSEFKEFRKSGAFKSIAQDIAADVKRVLKHCRKVKDGFESLDINNLLDEYATGDFDFNDQLLATLCRRKGLKLVTDDGDFKRHEIPVVTANKRLLG
jgi:predicted nucleic acid-binding protein